MEGEGGRPWGGAGCRAQPCGLGTKGRGVWGAALRPARWSGGEGPGAEVQVPMWACGGGMVSLREPQEAAAAVLV